jgi:hypothetical protein
MNITPHVAQNTSRRGGSAIDHRTTRHGGYAVSQRRRKMVEAFFGWLKRVAGQRKTKYRGLWRVGWIFTFAAAAYNLVRMRTLATLAVPAATASGEACPNRPKRLSGTQDPAFPRVSRAQRVRFAMHS